MSTKDAVAVCGRNPVRDLLQAGTRRVLHLYLSAAAQSGTDLPALAKQRGIPLAAVPETKLDTLAQGAHHQGVVALCPPLALLELDELWPRLAGKQPALLLADEVQDPQNLGALIRAAETLGFHALLLPARRSAGLTAAVERAASGAAAHLPLVGIGNTVQAMDALRERGVWLAGTVVDNGTSLWHTDLTGPVCVIVGNEGDGLRRLVRDRCDYRVSIPQQGTTQSLNVAAAGAIVMAEVMRQRACGAPRKGKDNG